MGRTSSKLKPHCQNDFRAKVKVGIILARLEKHVEGKVEMTSTQVSAAKILLDKCVSNAPTEINMDAAVTINVMKFSGSDG